MNDNSYAIYHIQLIDFNFQLFLKIKVNSLTEIVIKGIGGFHS